MNAAIVPVPRELLEALANHAAAKLFGPAWEKHDVRDPYPTEYEAVRRDLETLRELLKTIDEAAP